MHLNYFPDTHQEIVERALENGVEGMCTISTSLDQASLLQSYSDLYPQVWYSVGQHPHDVKDLDLTGLEIKEKLISLNNHPKMIAYGETGLDYYYHHSPKDAQIISFKAHIEAALEENLPIIVHTRDAQEDTIEVLSLYKGTGLKGVIHCFSGTQKLADFAIQEMNFLISFSGILTFPKALEIQEVAKTSPLNSIVIETDSPYLAPVPHRGKTNETMHVRHVFEKLCALRSDEDPEEISRFLRENTRRLFGI